MVVMQLEYERQDELGEAQEQRIEKLRLKRQKMCCEAAIYSFEAIIGIPLFIIILSTLTDK